MFHVTPLSISAKSKYGIMAKRVYNGDAKSSP